MHRFQCGRVAECLFERLARVKDTPTTLPRLGSRWTGGRVVECTSLENWHGGNSIEGSNPSPSAIAAQILGALSMKIIQSADAQTYTNANSLSESVEYPIGDKDIDCALVRINGLYPEDDKFAVNSKSKALFFCIEGNGTLEMKSGEKKVFQKNDVILIEIGEVYRYNAHCSLAVICTPPWTPEQHQKVS